MDNEYIMLDYFKDLKEKLWIRGLAVIVIMGKRCNKGMQLQEPQDFHFKVYK